MRNPATAAPRPQLSRTEISLRVKGILADQLVCHASALQDEAEIARVGHARFDARGAMRIVIAIEDSLDISLMHADLKDVVTVGQLVDIVEGAVRAKANAEVMA